MRILKLELENLNSLAGTWSIDFTHPAYAQSHDIFVICGPTGAGKTTILDAVTLALYGRTPRLEAINNGEGGNEIMTHGTGYCCARAVYSCSKGIYQSEFRQHRANSKATGKLQPMSFQITRLSEKSFTGGTLLCDGGEVIATGSTGKQLSDKTKEIIQLDYNQFCRSIMLAQGEFSRFLKSNSRERADILEKLTGTERYRAIGGRIAEKFSEVNRDFLAKKDERDKNAKDLLSAEEVSQMQQAAAECDAQLAAAAGQLAAIQKDLAFYEELERLQAERDAAAAAHQASIQALADFAQSERRLARAQAAKNCATVYEQLKTHRQEQQRDTAQREQLARDIAAAQTARAQAEQRAAQAQAELAAEERDMAAQQDVWKKVRALDVQIAAATQTHAEAAERQAQAERTLNGTQAKIARLEQTIARQEQAVAELDAYLAAHAGDGALPEAIATIAALKAHVDERQKKISTYQNSERSLLSEQDAAETHSAAARAELRGIEAQITAFISQDAVFIARLLQRELVDGTPCPVCGSPYHAAHKAEQEQAEQEAPDVAKAQQIAQESGSLNARREECALRLQKQEQRLEAVKADLKHAQENLASAQAECDESLAHINAALAPWNLTATAQTLPALLADLKTRGTQWSQKSAARESAAQDASVQAAERHALTEAAAAQQVTLAQAAEACTAALEQVQSLSRARTELFGTKSADAAEQAKTQNIARLKAESQKAEQTQQQKQKESAALAAQMAQAEQRIADRAPHMQAALDDFAEKLSANGFADEQAFADACMSDAEFAALAQRSEALKTQRTQTETSLADAQKSYDAKREQAPALRSKVALAQEQAECSARQKQLQKEMGTIQGALNTNAHFQARAQRLEQEYAALQEQHAIWSQMQKWAGVRQGADLSVFVQSLAFSSLLALANKNLYGITNRYRLVQKSAGQLDFEINDVFFAEPRSVSNLSGGEQFLVSLSLALGISEFASRNVRVDSLFLDEGFGTLSGDLRTEAINALKNLQKDGKMLGIITHVQDVIDEIERQIEVRQVSGGHSVLIGSGITRG